MRQKFYMKGILVVVESRTTEETIHSSVMLCNCKFQCGALHLESPQHNHKNKTKAKSNSQASFIPGTRSNLYWFFFARQVLNQRNRLLFLSVWQAA